MPEIAHWLVPFANKDAAFAVLPERLAPKSPENAETSITAANWKIALILNLPRDLIALLDQLAVLMENASRIAFLPFALLADVVSSAMVAAVSSNVVILALKVKLANLELAWTLTVACLIAIPWPLAPLESALASLAWWEMESTLASKKDL